MSELKEHLFCDCNEMFLENGSPLSNDIRPYYLKSEADKVIAELKNEVETQKRLRDMALASVPNALKVMKIIQHQKYKRCLAMARWCASEENRLEAISPIFDTDKEYWEYNSDYWGKWHNRWLEIAEKFKEAK